MNWKYQLYVRRYERDWLVFNRRSMIYTYVQMKESYYSKY